VWLLSFPDEKGCLAIRPLLQEYSPGAGRMILFETCAYIFYNLKFVY